MPQLYPSWIEIPAADLERALGFYRAVFELADTPVYDEPGMRIAVLLPSEKGARAPGVSLVQSPLHAPGAGGPIVNFHVDTHADLARAIAALQANGGSVAAPLVEMDDGVRYVVARDCEGNLLALSSYEPV